MSVVGCFGDCGFGSQSQPKGPREYKLVFHPPIQTTYREKDDSKWYTDMVNELATLGDDPNHLNEFGEAPLCVAAFKGSGMIVEEMLKQPNIRVNIKGKHGRTALYLAAEGGHIFIVKLLLQHPDIDVNSRNGPGGATALMGASRRGHSRIVELLLQHPRCEVDLNDKDGNTAAHHARTPSVKWRLHNHSHRSRSMETVLCSERRDRALGNLCRVSPLADTSLESSPGTPDNGLVVGVGEGAGSYRRHSMEGSIHHSREQSSHSLHSIEASTNISAFTDSPEFRRSSIAASSSGCSTRLSSASKETGGSNENMAALAQEKENVMWPSDQPLSKADLLQSPESGLRGRLHSSPAELLTASSPT